MLDYSLEKKPAFFRHVSFELFFEAEAMETETVVNDLNVDLLIDKELEALLAAQDQPSE
jgi:hypothetical protein